MRGAGGRVAGEARGEPRADTRLLTAALLVQPLSLPNHFCITPLSLRHITPTDPSFTAYRMNSTLPLRPLIGDVVSPRRTQPCDSAHSETCRAARRCHDAEPRVRHLRRSQRFQPALPGCVLLPSCTILHDLAPSVSPPGGAGGAPPRTRGRAQPRRAPRPSRPPLRPAQPAAPRAPAPQRPSASAARAPSSPGAPPTRCPSPRPSPRGRFAARTPGVDPPLPGGGGEARAWGEMCARFVRGGREMRVRFVRGGEERCASGLYRKGRDVRPVCTGGGEMCVRFVPEGGGGGTHLELGLDERQQRRPGRAELERGGQHLRGGPRGGVGSVPRRAAQRWLAAGAASGAGGLVTELREKSRDPPGARERRGERCAPGVRGGARRLAEGDEGGVADDHLVQHGRGVSR
jgi:hypothetical protein